MTERNSNVVDIFPTRIGIYTLCDHDKMYLKTACYDIINNYQNEKYLVISKKFNRKHYFDPGLGNNSLLDHPDFKKFGEWIKMCSIDYINNTLGYKCENVIVTSCWLNQCYKGGFQDPHVHANSLISGTYYVNFNPQLHSPLMFKNPNDVVLRPYLDMECYDWVRESGRDFVNVKHTEGSLMLWESHLSHYYDENKTDNRLSISFNVMPKTLTYAGYGFKLTEL